jgi:hypothetical protein
LPSVTTEPNDPPVAGVHHRGGAPRASWFALVFLVGAVAASACAGGADQLDMARVRQAVDTRAQTNYPGVTLGRSHCPSAVDKRRGASFVCILPIGGSTLRIRVTQLDANGHVRLEAQEAVIQKAAAEFFVGGHTSITSTVACGTQPVLVLAPGARFPCTVTFNDGTMQMVTVRVVDTAGTVALEAPPKP